MRNRTGTFPTLLIFIGKPIFWLLVLIINIIFQLSQFLNSALYLIGQITLLLFNRLAQTKPPKITLPKITLPQLPRPHKISLSRRLLLASYFLLLTSVIYITIYLPFLKNLPSPNALINRSQPLTTKILARDGTVLYKIYKDQNRTLVHLEDIPQNLKLATIAIEDQNFYNHGGFSYRGILRALRRNLFDDKIQGGSTITQQLVKNALLTPEKTLTRKIREILISIMVEIRFEKDEILEMYFNEVAYGGTAYGAEEASQQYFGKSVTQINLAQAALLAGLPAAPTTFSPFGANPELAKIRQHEVLRRMHEDGYIDANTMEKAQTEPLKYVRHTSAITAPHFVMYIRDLLVKQYGEQRVLQGGLEVTTSLDPQIQTASETAIATELNKLQSLNINNGAALITNPKTGEILAMVGSKDYFDVLNDGQVNVTLRPRQPGSSIKPLNYAIALENGFTPATIIPDTPICYRFPGQKPYCPKNYDNKFHGLVTLRSALANSYNVPAVKTLSINGVAKMIEKGRLMGITTWDNPSRFGLSLTLGGGEVTMADMAVLYGSLANSGMKVNLHPILKITDSKGKLLQKLDCCQTEQVLNPSVAYQLSNILSDNSARAPAFGTHSVLNVPGQQVAVKTGTTQNLRDNWAIGYTQDFLVVTWVGNNDNSPMSYVASGITGASPIWRRIIDFLLSKQTAPHTFTPPPELIKVKICTLTGQLACSGCPSKEEYFKPGKEPKNRCSPEKIEALKQKHKQEKEKRDQILQGTSTTQPN